MLLTLMDLIQDTLEHSASCCTTVVAVNCMSPTTTTPAYAAPSSGSCGVVVLDQVGSSPPVLLPKSPLSAHNQQQPSPQSSSLKSNHNNSSRPLTSSPLKNHPQPHHNVKGNNENSRFRQPPAKHPHRFNQAHAKNLYRRNNSLLSKVVFHSKQQVNNHNVNNESSKMNGDSVTLTNGAAKAPCDIINGKNLTKRPHLNGNSGSSSGGYKKTSKVDFASYANNKNCKRAVSFNTSQTEEARPKKTRRSRKRPKKRAFEERDDQQASLSYRNNPSKRVRTWTECNADEVSRLHRNCMQKGQPLAPYNTTQFIMNEHNAEKEIDFDELSGQIQQMHNSRKQSSALAPSLDSSSLDISVGGGGAGSDQESVRNDYYYSSPEDESFFLEQQFHEAYDTMHAERLNNMSKDDLLKEYLQIEKELEIMRQKSPGSSSNATDAKLALMASKSPRPLSKPSSPRHHLSSKVESPIRVSTPQRSNHHQHRNHHHHHHHCNGGTSHRNLFKENKHLRKLLKQVYNRYNSLLYCISYVNNTGNPASSSANTNSTSESAVAAALDESGISFNTTGNQDVTTADFHMTNELHYRIEKFIAHQPQSPLSSSSDSSNSSSPSSSYTSSSSTSHSSGSSASSSTVTSDDPDQQDHHQQGLLHSGEDRKCARQAHHYEQVDQVVADAAAIHGLLQQLLDLVAEGN